MVWAITSQVFLSIIITKHSTNISLYNMYPKSQIIFDGGKDFNFKFLVGWWDLQALYLEHRKMTWGKPRILPRPTCQDTTKEHAKSV